MCTCAYYCGRVWLFVSMSVTIETIYVVMITRQLVDLSCYGLVHCRVLTILVKPTGNENNFSQLENKLFSSCIALVYCPGGDSQIIHKRYILGSCTCTDTHIAIATGVKCPGCQFMAEKEKRVLFAYKRAREERGSIILEPTGWTKKTPYM